MSRSNNTASNAMRYAVEQVCGLYGVQITRMQSRTFNVIGAAGRWRPMFVGEWTDQFGRKHRKGMADMLARPRVPAAVLCERKITCPVPPVCREPFMQRVTIPLWIELKTGKDRMNSDQIAFQSYVETNGETYLLLHDEVDTLLAWFKTNGVEKQLESAIPVTPHQGLPLAALEGIPCRHCGDLRSAHSGKIQACRTGQAFLHGKVWSPQLRKEVTQ